MTSANVKQVPTTLDQWMKMGDFHAAQARYYAEQAKIHLEKAEEYGEKVKKHLENTTQ